MGLVDRFLEKGGSPTVVNMQQNDRLVVQLKFDAGENAETQGAFQPQKRLLFCKAKRNKYWEAQF
jgi:hypothetical protein